MTISREHEHFLGPRKCWLWLSLKSETEAEMFKKTGIKENFSRIRDCQPEWNLV
jgi:hypothetical protein